MHFININIKKKIFLNLLNYLEKINYLAILQYDFLQLNTKISVQSMSIKRVANLEKLKLFKKYNKGGSLYLLGSKTFKEFLKNLKYIKNFNILSFCKYSNLSFNIYKYNLFKVSFINFNSLVFFINFYKNLIVNLISNLFLFLRVLYIFIKKPAF